MGRNYAPKSDEFILGGKAADLWLRTADMCAAWYKKDQERVTNIKKDTRR